MKGGLPTSPYVELAAGKPSVHVLSVVGKPKEGLRSSVGEVTIAAAIGKSNAFGLLIRVIIH